jgi:hypothetical protein
MTFFCDIAIFLCQMFRVCMVIVWFHANCLFFRDRNQTVRTIPLYRLKNAPALTGIQGNPPQRSANGISTIFSENPHASRPKSSNSTGPNQISGIKRKSLCFLF